MPREIIHMATTRVRGIRTGWPMPLVAASILFFSSFSAPMAGAADLTCEEFKAKLDETTASLADGVVFFRYQDSPLDYLSQDILGIPDTKIRFGCTEEDAFEGIGASSWTFDPAAAEQWSLFTTAMALAVGLAGEPTDAASTVRRLKNVAVRKRQENAKPGEFDSGSTYERFGRYDVEYEVSGRYEPEYRADADVYRILINVR